MEKQVSVQFLCCRFSFSWKLQYSICLYWRICHYETSIFTAKSEWFTRAYYNALKVVWSLFPHTRGTVVFRCYWDSESLYDSVSGCIIWLPHISPLSGRLTAAPQKSEIWPGMRAFKSYPAPSCLPLPSPLNISLRLPSKINQPLVLHASDPTQTLCPPPPLLLWPFFLFLFNFYWHLHVVSSGRGIRAISCGSSSLLFPPSRSSQVVFLFRQCLTRSPC